LESIRHFSSACRCVFFKLHDESLRTAAAATLFRRQTTHHNQRPNLRLGREATRKLSLRLLCCTYQVNCLKLWGRYILTPIALLCSLLHYFLFRQLHGTPASGNFTLLPQSWTTTVSLALVTFFKALLLGSTSICSIQYLWRVLRDEPLPLSTIERLFQLRHDPLQLFDRRIFLSWPSLIAMYAWLVPLAAIYPPGALTVTANPHLMTRNMPISVPGMPRALRYSPLEITNASQLANTAMFQHRPSESQSGSDMVSVETTYGYNGPRSFLQPFAKYVLSSGVISQQAPPAFGDNSSYVLEFLGPQTKCQQVEKIRFSTVLRGGPIDDVSINVPNTTVGPSSTPNMPPGSTWSITRNKVLGKMKCNDAEAYIPNGPFDHSPREFLFERTMTNCSEHYVWYNANITYIRGIRSIAYTTKDIEPQPEYRDEFTFEWETMRNKFDFENPNLTLLEAATDFNDLRATFATFTQYWEAFAIYSSFLRVIADTKPMFCINSTVPKCDAQWTRPNGTIVKFGPTECIEPYFGTCLQAQNPA
jgi:hypothetical protein